MKVRYNKHNLAVAKVAAKEGSPENCAVNFTPEYSVATDGFKVAKVTVPKKESAISNVVSPIASPGQLMVPREVVQSIKLPKFNKDAPGTDAMYLTEKDEDKVTLTTYDIETGAKKNTEAAYTHGTHPMFQDILEEAQAEKGKTVRLNVDYLIDLLKIAKGLSHFVDIKVPTKKDAAVLISCKGGEDQEYDALIMPMRRDADHE